MHQRSRVRRAVHVGACGAAVLFGAPPANGNNKDNRVACNSAYKEYKTAQAEEQAGHLVTAKDLYQSCSRATCAGLVQKCSAKYLSLTADLPSVVPVVTDEAGEPRVDVQVKVDGELVRSRLDGRGITVEPGVHEFAFVGDGGVSATQRIMVIEGQKDRTIAVTIHWPTRHTAERTESGPSGRAARETSKDATPPTKEPLTQGASTQEPPMQERSLALPIAVGAGGLLTLAAGGLLTYWGRRDNDLLSRCSPNCSPSSVDHIRTLYTLSDISFGVGIAAVGAATWLWLGTGSIKEQPSPRAAYRFDLSPSRSGAIASVKGVF
jgi:hypothetical protein